MSDYTILEIEKRNDKNRLNMLPIYLHAFQQEEEAIWGDTEFYNEIEDICYKRAISCFYDSKLATQSDRHKLIRSYLLNMSSADDPADTLNRFDSILPTNNLYVKRAINNLCMAYNEPPTRIINGKNSTQLTELLDNSGYNWIMQKAYRIMKLTGECLIKPYINNKRLDWQYYTPDRYRVKIIDNKLNQVWIPFTEWKDKQRIWKFWVWDNKTLKCFDTQLKPQTFEYNNQIVYELLHNYGDIPFELFEADNNNDLWELIQGQLECNVLDYLIKENYTYNAMSIWIIKNFGYESEGLLKLAPGAALIRDYNRGEDEPTAETLSPTSYFQELEDLKQIKIKAVLKQLGLPTGLVENNSQELSGEALKIDRKELDEIRREDLYLLEYYDELLINKTALFLSNDDKSSYIDMFNSNYDVEVDYTEMSLTTNPKDEFDLYERQFNAGLINVASYVTKITGKEFKNDAEAIKYINDNKNNLQLIKGDNNDNTTIGQYDINGGGFVQQGSDTSTSATNESGNQGNQNDVTNTSDINR